MLQHGNYTALHMVTDWLPLFEVYPEVAQVQLQYECIESQFLWFGVLWCHIRSGDQRCSRKQAGNYG